MRCVEKCMSSFLWINSSSVPLSSKTDFRIDNVCCLCSDIEPKNVDRF